MPNQITAAGLETKSLPDLVSELTTALQTIYGPDINADADTPDGQWLNTIAQAAIDNLDLVTQVYTSFDPDQAVGVSLDSRVAINGLKRKGGTFTLQDMEIVTDRALNLVGLDAEIDNPDGTGYTVQDNAGTKFILAASQTISGAGTYTYQFRAQNPGAIETTPNTITTAVTIILGVVSVNNPSAVTSVGLNQETDVELRERRKQSVALSSKGYLSGLLAALLNVNGVTSAFVYENNTDATDADSIPEHSIWVIVNGGDDTDIANAIYSKRNSGAGMKGSQVVNVVQPDLTLFTVKFDRVVSENLYIEFDASSIDGIGTIDTTYIKQQIVERLVPGVFERVNINELATIIQEIDPNCLVTNAGFALSGGGPFTDTLRPSSKNKQFALATVRINITVV